MLELFEHPRHPYTQGLLRAIPRLDHPRKAKLVTIEGTVPALDDLPPGCRFQNRCAVSAGALRARRVRRSRPSRPDHEVACYRWREVATA